LIHTPTVDVEMLGFGAIWICRLMPTFWRNMLSPSSGAEMTRSESESHYDWQSVSHSWCQAPSRTHNQILVLCDDCYDLCLLDAPCLMRGWVCHLSEVSVFFILLSLYRVIYMSVYGENMHNRYRPLSIQALWSRLCLILLSLCYDSCLVTWTVVSLTAAKFKPVILSMLGFTLSYIANICADMILYDICLHNLVMKS
jgi:glucose-6-phosphate-specific signal transduction histidine kinase